jgi:cell division protein FtsL
MSRASAAFLPLWTAAVVATSSAFVLDLALRGRSVQLGYQLGAARQEQARLREVQRVLQLEAASYKTPERIEIVARSLLGMESPPPERIISIGPAAAPPTAATDNRLDVAVSGAAQPRGRDRNDNRPIGAPP